MFNFRTTAGLAVLIATGLIACHGESATAPTPGGETSSTSGSGAATSGTLAIHLTDSPFSDAKALLVTFTDVSVHRADPGEWRSLPFASGASRTCDLKKLNGPTDVLGVGALPAGKYTQIRLNVSDAHIYFDNASSGPACAAALAPPAGDNAAVTIPSGEVKLNNEFTLTGTGATITLDFDGDQSVRQTGNGNGNGKGSGKYMMSPVVRLVSIQ